MDVSGKVSNSGYLEKTTGKEADRDRSFRHLMRDSKNDCTCTYSDSHTDDIDAAEIH
jgi:hypothetical protein